MEVVKVYADSGEHLKRVGIEVGEGNVEEALAALDALEESAARIREGILGVER